MFAELTLRLRIPIHERVELPEELIPADSRVEIDAKITAGEYNITPRTNKWTGYCQFRRLTESS